MRPNFRSNVLEKEAEISRKYNSNVNKPDEDSQIVTENSDAWIDLLVLGNIVAEQDPSAADQRAECQQKGNEKYDPRA